MHNLSNKFGLAASLGILIAIFFSVYFNEQQQSALLRGDFPGFYVLAKIIVSGESSKLYDLDLQRQIQNAAWPALSGGFLISVYPPSLALILAPLGYFSPTVAQVIFSSLSFLSLLIAFTLLKNRVEFLRSSPWLLFALLITNAFLLVGTLGGQNTAFSIVILSLGMSLLEKEAQTNSRTVGIAAGLAFSLWLFKPQFGIFVFPALVLLQLWVPLVGFIFGAILHYLAGLFLLGPLWPLEWVRKLAAFSALNYDSNNFNQASIVGTLNVLLKSGGMPSSQIQFITLLSILALTSLALIFLLRARIIKKPNVRSAIFWLYLGAVPIIAPQTLFYDIGIIFVAALNCLKLRMTSTLERKTLGAVLTTQVLGWICHEYREQVSYPLFVLFSLFYLLFGSYFVAKLLRQAQKESCERI